ncbi:MAG: DEAD/DEAH box helicase [Lachnospiraceae bacterium]|nr:DEAD/DEAH box helicase [Lachnospiraceae bacterium]
MRIKDYFRSFREEELEKGAELYFAGDLILPSAKKGKKKAVSASGMAAKERELSGQAKERDIRSKEYTARFSLRLNLKYGLVAQTSCNCAAFEEDGYGCPHVAALLTSYMIEENGEDIFRNTRLETLLCNRTGAEDPFLPGVLKRTDDRLLSLMSGGREPALPVWKEATRTKSHFEVQCTIQPNTGGISVELKAGPKRLYLIRDLKVFLKAYEKEEAYAFGRTEYVLSRGMFEPRGARLLDFLSDLVTASEKGLYGHRLFPSGSRAIALKGKALDDFFEMYDTRTLILAGDKELEVSLARKGLAATLKKKAYGAELVIGELDFLTASINWIYLLDKEGIFRVRVESTEQARELLALLNWSDPMYIRESDIETVCRKLLSYFRDNGTLTMRGMELEDYQKEEPTFCFELDYPRNKVLACVPYAVYPQQGLRCPLYDNVTAATGRNPAAEGRAASVLPSMFQTLDTDTFTLYSKVEEEELFEFMKDRLPVLEEMGEVMVTNTLKQKKVRFMPAVSAHVSVEKGNLLLSLQATGLSSEEMAEILGKYRQKKRYYRLKSGEFLSLEDVGSDTLETLAELYHSYGKDDPEHIRVPAFRALYLQEMLEKRDDAVLEGNQAYYKLVASMSEAGKGRLAVPGSLKSLIRPYQKEGFRWICTLKKCGFGGILADDMGLGKTLQTLAFLLAEKAAGKEGDELRTLVVCPASLVYNWQKEIETYAPELSFRVIAGLAEARKEMIRDGEDADVWITSYDLLKRDISLYEGLVFANEIIDEAQYVKNQNTQAAQSVRVIDSRFRLALTGTPIENHLGELWSIMDYLMPGFLYSNARFQKEYELPIVAEKDEALLARLRRMVHPFILRRLKRQVLKDLPAKLEETITVRLCDEQKRLYDAATEQVRQALYKTDDSQFGSEKLQFLSMLTKLRQICCDPSLVYEDYRGGSAKLEACMDLVSRAVEAGHKLLLFSQFTTMLDIIGVALERNGIAYHRIDGSVSKEKRMEMVDSFANDDVPVFCISLKAGGTGLNLTAADIVIHYDPWWNQAAQDQATDRTHRIGQTQRVTVYELIAQDTVEEKIMGIKDAKKQLVEDVLTGQSIGSASLSKEELLSLLEEMG